MYNDQELNDLANYAKEKLNINNESDPYAEFRDEIDEIEQESNVKSAKEEDKDEGYVVPKNVPDDDYMREELNNREYIRNEMNDSEYKYEEEIMNEATVVNDNPQIFPGGPTKSQIDSWKNKYQGAGVYVVDVCEKLFVFRTLNRFEYKQIIRQAQLDAAQREEVICETTVLFPEEYTWKDMAKKDAGIPSTLSQIIMQKSGFTEEYLIERL